ncbi:uncharacterized protein LOC111241776 isoform X1 [Vigna radiata var. radiata]|uniref:Uncharacterized protein LOC111241776 isoform X1 n=1 Tax=Vigna radiata var. radiata TaxID=3916 RepID=A0A3Q0F4M7_VIGRR|nr:uncharacterized protein LOC111241776 isoform X1 [Vigna radiata var. radiata]
MQNIAVTTSSHNQSHNQTPSPTDADSSKLFWLAHENDWPSAQPIVENNPDIVRIPLTERGDRVLHVAAYAESTTFVEELVKLLVNLERPRDLLIPNSDGMLPVHLAVLTGNQKMVLHLCSWRVLDVMVYQDIKKLFFMSIRNNMFNAALQIFGNKMGSLSIARYEEGEERLTAMHMLARKPSEILNMKSEEDDNGKGVEADFGLFFVIWTQISTLPKEEILELITQPSVVLFDAIKSGHDLAVKLLLSLNPRLFIKDPKNGQNLVHLLVQYRHFDYFRFIDFKREETIRAVDIEGNSVLHMAAHLPLQFQVLSGLRASIQMQKELAWFKKVEKEVPSELRSMRNKKGKRPIDVFYDEHKKLSDEIKESAKGIANSGMVVATLVATVAFAAALTVPGDKKSDWFVVFIITNSIALFSSSASILSFLSNFTSSRFAESEFVISLHPSLTFGPALLIISVAAMVVAFIATSFLIFEDTRKWVSYVVATMGVFPLILFPLFQFSLFDDLIWSRWYRPEESMVPVFTTLYMFMKQLLKFVRNKPSYSNPNPNPFDVIKHVAPNTHMVPLHGAFKNNIP